MVASPPPVSGRVFLSYRREETAYPAAWLFDRLADRFGAEQVFKDVDSIELGDDFVEVITSAVGSCDVLLAVIGPRWLDATDEDGRRRLDDPDDFVRLEIEAALTRNVRVIPILIDDAPMPRAADLPPSMARLVRRQALELSPNRFELDTGRLLKVLDKTLAEVRTAQADAALTRAPAGTAADSSTAPPTTAEQPEQAEPGPTPSVLPAAPTAAAAGTPPDSGKPRDTQRRRRSSRVWVLAGAAVGVVLILVIVAIVASSDGRPSPAAGVIFRDDFSSPASGWADTDNEPMGGQDTDGAYRISVPAPTGGRQSVPIKASRVYPSAPPNLRIEVQGHMLPQSDIESGYGIRCRMDGGNSYEFTVTTNDATIAKNGDDDRVLRGETAHRIDPHALNRLQATCTNVEVEGQQSAYLVFSVNGRVLVEYTDTKNPYLAGTVGLSVWTYQAERPGVAEFDNFVVTQA